MPVLGLFLGIIVGLAAAANGRSGPKYSALIGAGVFAIGYAITQPEGFDLAGSHFRQPMGMQILMGAISGAIWCGLWGLLGAYIGRKMRSSKSPETEQANK